jgi:GNAT superfamily N-acetyltransferase
MKYKKVSRKLGNYNEIVDLYTKSFPSNERLPFWLITLLAKRKCADFFAFYDNECFCGITYLIYYKNLTFIFYLAVNTSIRSKGYGSRILQWIEKYKKNNDIILCIEPIEESDNYEQRVQRLKFYQKNGYVQTGYQIMDGEPFELLFKGKKFSDNMYHKLIKNFSFGFISKKIITPECNN